MSFDRARRILGMKGDEGEEEDGAQRSTSISVTAPSCPFDNEVLLSLLLLLSWGSEGLVVAALTGQDEVSSGPSRDSSSDVSTGVGGC